MQLALQSSCVMLSNNAKSLLCAPLDLSSGALAFKFDAQSIILTFGFCRWQAKIRRTPYQYKQECYFLQTETVPYSE